MFHVLINTNSDPVIITDNMAAAEAILAAYSHGDATPRMWFVRTPFSRIAKDTAANINDQVEGVEAVARYVGTPDGLPWTVDITFI